MTTVLEEIKKNKDLLNISVFYHEAGHATTNNKTEHFNKIILKLNPPLNLLYDGKTHTLVPSSLRNSSKAINDTISSIMAGKISEYINTGFNMIGSASSDFRNIVSNIKKLNKGKVTDDEFTKILNENFNKAKKEVLKNKKIIDLIATSLVLKEVKEISQEEFNSILKNKKIPPTIAEGYSEDFFIGINPFINKYSITDEKIKNLSFQELFAAEILLFKFKNPNLLPPINKIFTNEQLKNIFNAKYFANLDLIQSSLGIPNNYSKWLINLKNQTISSSSRSYQSQQEQSVQEDRDLQLAFKLSTLTSQQKLKDNEDLDLALALSISEQESLSNNVSPMQEEQPLVEGTNKLPQVIKLLKKMPQEENTEQQELEGQPKSKDDKDNNNQDENSNPKIDLLKEKLKKLEIKLKDKDEEIEVIKNDPDSLDDLEGHIDEKKAIEKQLESTKKQLEKLIKDLEDELSKKRDQEQKLQEKRTLKHQEETEVLEKIKEIEDEVSKSQSELERKLYLVYKEYNKKRLDIIKIENQLLELEEELLVITDRKNIKEYEENKTRLESQLQLELSSKEKIFLQLKDLNNLNKEQQKMMKSKIKQEETEEQELEQQNEVLRQQILDLQKQLFQIKKQELEQQNKVLQQQKQEKDSKFNFISPFEPLEDEEGFSVLEDSPFEPLENYQDEKQTKPLDVLGDGNCLIYSLILSYLGECKNDKSEFIKRAEKMFPKLPQDIKSYQYLFDNFEDFQENNEAMSSLNLLLRNTLAEYTEKNIENDEFYISTYDDFVNDQPKLTKQEYIKYIKTSKTWLGEVELESFSKIFDCQITVQRIYQKDKELKTDFRRYPENDDVDNNKTQIIVRHTGGNHYTYLLQEKQQQKITEEDDLELTSSFESPLGYQNYGQNLKLSFQNLDLDSKENKSGVVIKDVRTDTKADDNISIAFSG